MRPAMGSELRLSAWTLFDAVAAASGVGDVDFD
jgi:hypothetical protein